MDNYINFIDWRNLELMFTLIMIGMMIFSFVKDKKFIQKTLQGGVAFFIFSIFLDIVGLIEISENINALAFITVSISLVSLFWIDSGNWE